MKNDNSKNNDFQTALSKARGEFDALMLEKGEKLNTQDIVDLRSYCKKKTSLTEPDDNLTNEQKAWKFFYNTLDKQLSEIMPKEDKEKIDKALNEMDDMTIIRESIEKICKLAINIDDLLSKQTGYILVHSEEQDQNAYLVSKKYHENRITNESLSNEEHIKSAEAILNLIKASKKGYIDPFLSLNDEIQQKLLEFENELNNGLYSRMMEIKFGPDGMKETREWLDLTKESFSARIMATNSIIKQIEMDAFIPNRIIKNNGDASIVLSDKEKEDAANKFAEYATLWKLSNEKEEQIKKKRDKLSQKLWAEFREKYGDSNIENVNMASDDNKQSNKTNIPWHQNFQWYHMLIVLVVFIVLANIFGQNLLFTFIIITSFVYLVILYRKSIKK